jgi:hypothetical protein
MYSFLGTPSVYHKRGGLSIGSFHRLLGKKIGKPPIFIKNPLDKIGGE